MCHAADFWSIALLVLLAAIGVVNAVLQHRFLHHLEVAVPSLWSKLGKRKVWTDDGNISYAAAQLYLLEGEYKSNGDQSLVEVGDRARVAFFCMLAALLIWGVHASVLGALPRFSCLLRIFV